MFARLVPQPLTVTALVICFAVPAFALPTQIVHIETPQCDVLSIPLNVEEIGDQFEFPGTDEDLSAADLGTTNFLPCPASDDPTISNNAVVDIRNLTGRAWRDVWYVADAETNITNFDGEANDINFGPVREAFRIDAIGVNRPLISESLIPNGIWDINESWQFVLQDYTNSLAIGPDAITSQGVGDASKSPASGIVDSSGSIIGVPVPEPGTAVLALIALLASGLTKRGR